MLGHLVFTGHAASSEFEARPAAAPAPKAARSHQPGWLGRLFAQIFPRR